MSNINIVLVMDQNYLIPTSVTIFSAIKNKKPESIYSFFIICNQFNIDINRKLKAFERSDVKINLIQFKTSGFEKLHNASKSSYCVASPAALLKFKIADLLKNELKALYIDGDIVVRCDLAEIFNTDISNHFAAVVPDTGSLYSNNPIVKKYKNYFNSGVMLLNLKELRNNAASEKLFKLKKESINESLMDQNIFNEYFNGKVRLLDVSYNCLFVNLVRSRNKFTIKDFNKKFGTNYINLFDIEKNAKIIHYSSKDKPWKYTNSPLADEWNNYYYEYCNKFGFDSSILQQTQSINYRNDAAYIPKLRREITVSLTSFPGRINVVHLPISDLLNQSIQVNRVVLYLSKSQFPGGKKQLPDNLLNLEDKGLLIKFVDDDLRAHKKYFYAFQEYANDLIITIDDDIRLDKFTVERLILAHYKHPRSIIASRVHLITGNLKEEKINSYDKWRKEYNGWINIPSHQLFATHGAGTLFPPHCLNLERLCNKEDIKSLSLLADDIWLKVNEVLSNTSIVLAAPHKKLELIDGSQEEALWKSNVLKNLNDEQLIKILLKYNKINSKNTVVKRILQFAPYPNSEAQNKSLSVEYVNKNTTHFEELYIEQLERNKRLKNSTSYKIGRFITFVPRKILAALK